MSKNIVDGKLVEMSPSMINAFDADTTFGCERKGWFKYVMGLPEPQTGNQELGENLHKLVEQRLLTGQTPAGEGEAFGLYLAGQSMIEAVAARVILGVEAALPDFTVASVKVKGYCDVVPADGIVDWKTSSDIRRYGKTSAQLAVDTQMVLYAKAFHPTLERVKLAHGQFQTKGRKSTDFVEVEVTQEHLDAHIEKVIVPKIERMKLVASMTNAEDAVPDRKKCFNCAFKTRCPNPESQNIMSFFSKFNKGTTTSTVPAAAIINGGDMAAKTSPPDAPPSNPEKAAVPVEGFSPVPPPKTEEKKERKMKIVDEPAQTTHTKDAMVAAMDKPAFKGESETDRAARMALEYSQKLKEEVDRATAANAEAQKPAESPKRGPGRPPGAKNKPKVEEAPPAQEAAINKSGAERAFKAITVTKGATINVGNFNSVRFDVSVTSEQHTYEEIYAEVSRRLDEEAAKYEAEMAKGSSVPAKGVVSK